ncbi:MAG: carboxylesterase/lipase family protein [Spirochaetales bacterium]|nr:carboxylesterase/lipase family protein [Spirochaetales bacterium]
MTKTIYIFIFILLLVILSGCENLFVKPAPSKFIPSAWDNRAVVLTSYGFIRGTRGEAGTWVWKGVPYARPPVGELRWKAPEDMQPWSGTRNTFEFCAPCTQIDLAFNGVSGKEDCLYLNIWRPQTPETGLPVYVWIHGGRNVLLSSSMFRSYYGHALAAQSTMVFVSVNYRLGAFGWLSHPALRENESPEDDSGNYGTLDIIHALQWIRENISAFGGDPENVLIASGAGGGRNILPCSFLPWQKVFFQKPCARAGVRY